MRSDPAADLYIDTPATLSALVSRLSDSHWLALDTEFIREKTFFPQLCLVQIASHDCVACVDPLALKNLDLLFELLFEPRIVKVLHAAHQDLEIFYHRCGRVPGPIFDTQIAAGLLGQGEQIGYAPLAQLLTGIELDKSQSRTDWAQRPLRAAQIAYAADDVRYLREVYISQSRALAELGRHDWLADDFAALSEPARYAIVPDTVWHRIRGTHKLRAEQLAILRALAAWREMRARSTDRPRKWIISDEALLELARRMPADAQALEQIRNLEAGTVRRHGEALLAAIAAARAEPAENWPVPLPTRRSAHPEQDALIDTLMAVVRLRGLQHGIAPATLASRRDLERIAEGDTTLPLLSGWRADIAGHDVQAVIAGRLTLATRDGEIHTLEPAQTP